MDSRKSEGGIHFALINAVENWVKQVFQVVKIAPPEHIVQYYVEKLVKQEITYQQVQTDAIQMANASQSKQSQNSEVNPGSLSVTSNQSSKSSISPSVPNETAPKMSEDDKIKEYITLLYSKYTGKSGDPASVNFLFKNIKDKTYSLTQAEYFVKFSKEAKAYVANSKVKQEHERESKTREFVLELFRVYLSQDSPLESEVAPYIAEILNGTTTLQATEDEFRLLSINVPKKK